jgi:hypothetical protein
MQHRQKRKVSHLDEHFVNNFFVVTDGANGGR